MSDLLIFKWKQPYIKHTKKLDFRFFSQNFLSEALICSFIMSNLSESLTVAHLSWATWAIRSQSLICLEGPEGFAHSHSFVLSDLSKLLTVLNWFERIEQMIDERIPSLDILNQPILEMYLNSFFSCKGLDNIFSCSVGVGNFVGSIGDMKIEEDCPTACRPTDHQA